MNRLLTIVLVFEFLFCFPVLAQKINLNQIQGTGTPGSCSVLFAAGGNARFLGQDNANFCWDSTNHRLGIGTNTPSQPLHVVGNALITSLAGSGTRCVQTDSTGLISATVGACSGTSPYTTTVSAQTSVSISAATHGQGTLATSFCFDNSSPRVAVVCSYTRDGSGNMVFTFNPAFTGLIEIR